MMAMLSAAAAASDAAPIATPAAKPGATVEQPRAFGYVIGDIATQRILLELNGRPFTPESLPTPGRASIWFERHAVRTETDARGRRWLAIDYQLMNAPKSVALASLPALKLNSRTVGESLQVAAWPLSVSPVTAEKPVARAGLGTLRPDRSTIPTPLLFTQRALTLSVVALFAVLATWFIWWRWRNWRATSSQPFAIASREIRKLDDAAPEAWYALHRAFDGTAGRAIRAETLPLLFEKAPQLRPFEGLIEQFYAQSALRFFSGQATASTVPIHALCRDLRQIEKRHES
jgi:mxaA protein